MNAFLLLSVTKVPELQLVTARGLEHEISNPTHCDFAHNNLCL